MHRHFYRFMHRHHGGDCEGWREGGWFGDEGYDFHGRRGRHGGFGHHGESFGDWGDLQGGGRRGGGRMLGHGDLKLLLLALIEQQPRHGYELIRTIEEMFLGQYSPSPGAIYPTLTMLEELGYASVENEQGGRKLYAITDEGRVYLDGNRTTVEAIIERTRESARLFAKLSVPMSVRKAMHALKHAVLMRGSDWKAEAQRVADILERAAAEIASGRKNDDK
ncbi:PadR family transcriptional regulator [Dyella nitratireducens]|uniref:PadR family transcriptional regulator n=1 Tax=Dyella nitratireducens TaxID=1849580 RepID=A0ABQ1FV67_9GAMM|nr:PadR family transcriptional regulator [Dyella nitratireducens]GGA30529.1 PadR family transcriptional regulator [Dyella nitratireducens]GLQ42993.1 PadR family transcriptional regulator [Dyella nitratireducens]